MEVSADVRLLYGTGVSIFMMIPFAPSHEQIADLNLDAHLQFEDRAFRVLCDEYVQADSGTGIVHQAPAFGEEDHRICIANGIVTKDEMPPCPLDDAGRFTKEVTDFEGQHVKVCIQLSAFHMRGVLS